MSEPLANYHRRSAQFIHACGLPQIFYTCIIFISDFESPSKNTYLDTFGDGARPPPEVSHAIDSMSFEQKPTTPFHSMDEPSSLCNISTEVCDKKFEHIGGPSEYVSKSSTVAKNYGCNCCQHRQMTQDEGKVEECQKNNSTRQIPMTKNRPQHLCIPHPTIDHNGLSWPGR